MMRLMRSWGLTGVWRSFMFLLTGVVIGVLITSSLTLRSDPVRVSKEKVRLYQHVQSQQRCKCPPQTLPVVESHKPKPQPLRFVLQANSSYVAPVHIEDTQPSDLPQYLSREYTLKQQLLVAVLTNQDHLKMANVVYDTWGQFVSQLVFFVGEDCNVSSPIATGLPLVQVPGVSDSQVNSVKKIFTVLKYLSENYLNSYHWFLLATDNMYVRVSKLEQLLVTLDPSSLVYLGRSANGRHGDSTKLSLMAHEHYCLGSTGVVLSAGLLTALASRLDVCHSAAVSMGGSGEEEWVWPDVELGRCVSRMTRTQCAQSAEARAYFVIDYSGTLLTPASVDQSKQQFSELITYHPVNDPPSMMTLHHYYTHRAFKVSLEKAELDRSLSSTACNELAKMHVGGVSPDNCVTSLCPGETLNSKCPSVGVVNDPPKSFQPSTIYDYLSWQYFDDRTLYSDKFIHPSTSLQQQRDSRKELQVMLSKAVQSASERYGRHLKFKRVINGWVRHNPFRGSEYIVDCLFLDGFKRVISKRVSLVRPLATNYITLKDNYDVQATVHFIVPLSNVNERFVEFMTMYEEIGLKSSERVHLVLVVYGSRDGQFVNSVLEPYQSKYPEALVTVVEGRGEFSRGKALHLGMSKLHTEDLAFLCDVDMSVSEQFIERCRKNTIRGKRVYYPEFFKLYNLDYVYRKEDYPSKVALRRQHGHWAYYSFGMLCVYKSDYLVAGGMNTNIKGWGEEDVKFFEKVVRKKLEVFRAPDPGLSHRWHEKTCPKSLTNTQYKHCLSSRGENLADRIELANYIYEKKVQLRYDGHGQPHNVQLSFTNQTADSIDSLET